MEEQQQQQATRQQQLREQQQIATTTTSQQQQQLQQQLMNNSNLNNEHCTTRKITKLYPPEKGQNLKKKIGLSDNWHFFFGTLSRHNIGLTRQLAFVALPEVALA